MSNKIIAVLKMAGILAPAIVLGLSTAGIGTAYAVYSKEKSRIFKLYRETDKDFSFAQTQQIEILDKDFHSGLIDEEEYNEKKEYLSSDKFTQSVMELDTTLDDEIKSLKNSKVKFLIATYTSLATWLISGGISCYFYPGKIKEHIMKKEIYKNASKYPTKTPKPIIYKLEEEKESKSARKRLEDYHEEVEEPHRK